jgi:hypothetical protein
VIHPFKHLAVNFKKFSHLWGGPLNAASRAVGFRMIMRRPIERVVSLNDLVDSVPEEIYRQIQSGSDADEGAAESESHNMSDKEISKSQRVRDYLELHPKAKGKEILSALSQYGVKQSDIGNVKSKMKKSGTTPRATATVARAPAAAPAASQAFGISVKALETGTAFLKEAGSLNNARELLTIIDQIRSSLVEK